MPKIGVTGGCGYLGSRVCIRLQEEGFEVVPVDNYSSNKVERLPNMEVEEADISSLNEVQKVFSDVDAVIHLAASSSLEACSNYPEEAFKNNIQATSNIAWFCRENSIPLSFASSVAVFGDPDERPIDEETPKNPTNLYGKTKLIGENIIEDISKDSFRSHIFNIANICGSHRVDCRRVSRNNVLEIFLQKALEGKPMKVYEPGGQARDFISVRDVADAFVKSVNQTLSSEDLGAEKFLLATGNSTSVLELTQKISDSVQEDNISTNIELVENPREGEIVAEDFVIDCTKLREELDFQAKENLGEIIDKSIPK